MVSPLATLQGRPVADLYACMPCSTAPAVVGDDEGPEPELAQRIRAAQQRMLQPAPGDVWAQRAMHHQAHARAASSGRRCG